MCIYLLMDVLAGTLCSIWASLSLGDVLTDRSDGCYRYSCELPNESIVGKVPEKVNQ